MPKSHRWPRSRAVERDMASPIAVSRPTLTQGELDVLNEALKLREAMTAYCREEVSLDAALLLMGMVKGRRNGSKSK